jgi:hypothetical protein
MNNTVLARLATRFDLQADPADAFTWVGTVIQPTTDVGQLLQVPGQVQGTSAAVGGGVATVALCLTVPSGKRFSFQVVRASRKSGDNTIDAIKMFDASTGLDMTLYSFSASTDELIRLPQPLRMDELDSLRVSTTGAGSATSTWAVAVWCESEDAF